MPVWERGLILSTTFLTVALHGSSSVAREVSFEDRVSAQRAIERVFWHHRIWPKENRQPKPHLSMVIGDDAIRLRVEDYLKASNALEAWWHRPLTRDSLQSEVERMARDTRDPDMLRELFEALGNDSVLVAETLGRQTIADRLIRSWYTNDSRYHADSRRQAEVALSECGSVACLETRGGRPSEITWRLRDSDLQPRTFDSRDPAIELASVEWNQRRARLASKLGGTADSLPQGRLSALEETAEGFVVTRVVSQDATSLTVGTVEWPKQSFNVWWSGARGNLSSGVATLATPFVLPEPNGSSCVDDTWLPTAFDNPGGRRQHTAVWTGTEMIVWGGIGEDELNTGGRYNPATDTWAPTSVGLNTPSARVGHVAVWTGTEMIVWGGLGPHYQNTGGRYDPVTDTWTATSTENVPSPRWGHVGVWSGSNMIVWGGFPSGSPDSGGRYDPTTNTWARLSIGINAPASRSSATAVWTGTEMIVWGGSDGRYWNTGGRYNPSSDTWLPTSVGPNVPYYRAGHSAVWTGTEMIIWGGYIADPSQQYFKTGGRYDPSTDTWLPTSIDGNVPPPRSQHTAVWDGTRMIVWGGSSGYGTAFNTGSSYEPATDSWIPISEGANVPDPRFLHTAIWTGTEMIVWGGLHPSQDYSNTGGRYIPSSDTWVPTHRSSPDGRRFHSALWTGVEMIVWGGTTLSHASGTGGSYRPVTDTWVPTSMGSNLPFPRYEHVAVWTGTEMIVWGGIVYSGYHHIDNSGGRYSPSTDTWLPTSIGENVPSARSYATAVWTGTQMVVWGGAAQAGDTNSGARYDPSTDTWLPTSIAANVPAARSNHTAVWTGTEMIVWGGYHFTQFTETFNTGGRYDPSRDAWLPTSTGTNAPSPRAFHAAVWTGVEMIVWAGSGVTDGGRYDPSTDSWKQMSIEHGHSVSNLGFAAVWADAELIVWGGWNSRIDGHEYSNRGGRYSPSTDTWAPTSIGENVPTRRIDLAGVWTGTEMIVWGGYEEINLTTFGMQGTGGRYCAVCSPITWYRDVDGDGYGDVAMTQTSCMAPSGFVVHAGDCDDASPEIHAGSTEICNGIDENCDTIVDNGGGELCADADVCTADVCASTIGCLPAHMSSNFDVFGFSATRIDGRDLGILANAWNSCPGDPRYNTAVNLDQGGSAPESCIDLNDFHLFMNTFANNCP